MTRPHSTDAFLDGRLQVRQPIQGYRAGIDPVLLAASVPARAGDHVLELGCGAGTALLCLGHRLPGVQLTGLELQGDYAALARQNAVANAVALQIFDGDLSAPPAAVKALTVDYVLANPPYYCAHSTTPPDQTDRAIARTETLPLAAWIDAAARRLRPKGWLHLIQTAERLPDVLAACTPRFGALQVLPIAPRTDRPARLILIRARKGAKGAFQLCAPLILHSGAAHHSDGDDFSPQATALLRHGKALPWPSPN